MSKGYRPEHIELEKEWHLGHDPKGGRADICVTDTSGNMLFIIECKTWGREYDKALNNTKSDGAQLFSYWQQEQSCKWLVLYASDLKGGCIVHKASTIDCSDDANIVLLSKKDKSIKLYRDANTASAKYEAWKETYGRQIHDDLIFSKDSVAYQIGVKPLRKKDLRDFTPDDKIVNKFEEILRHNNVSDKENAFNRLVALFICKLVDESIKDEDDEVEFQYKQGTDTYETLQDRLQRLHRDGMEKFMREEILYVPADYPEWLFLTYTGSKRKSAIEDLRNTIRILKFYSNNEFTFKDVHNEELFYQNGKILVEMVQLFEKYRIVYPSKHQFLGDLFEQLLNKGFKQNEGQFFTPIPITRFIWDIDENEYRAFLNKSISVADLEGSEYFKMYVMAFADSSDAKNLLKTKAYQQKSAGEQAAAYLERLYSYAYSIEREKLFYFSLVYQQTTVIITAPADNKAQKEFLGYDWSNRKGNEGIQIITPGGKMYDDADRVAQGTLAHSIKKSFDGMAPSFNEEQATYASVVNTKNMLDYSRVNFNKALRTSVKKAFHISSKYPLVKLASVCDLNTSKTEIHDTPDDLLVSFIDMASVSSEGFIERKVDRPYGEVCNGGYTYFAEGDFIIAKITPCMENGKCAIAEGLTNGIGFGSSEFHTFRCHASEILTKFLFLLLNQTTVRKAAEDAMTGASGHRRVPAAFYEEMLIPVPPIPVQQQVIDECAKIDEEYNATRMSIETYRQKTADLFAELDAVMSTTEGNRLSLSDTEKFSVAIGKRVLDKELASNGTIPVYSANVTAPFGFIDKLLITDFSAPSVLWGIDGDWMTSYLPSDMPFYPTDHCGVLRCKNSEVNPRYLAHILEVEGRKMGFSRSYRASIDRVHGIAFTVPDISIQNNAMSKVADYEMAIKELEGSLEKIASRRSEIIRKALAE